MSVSRGVWNVSKRYLKYIHILDGHMLIGTKDVGCARMHISTREDMRQGHFGDFKLTPVVCIGNHVQVRAVMLNAVLEGGPSWLDKVQGRGRGAVCVEIEEVDFGGIS